MALLVDDPISASRTAVPGLDYDSAFAAIDADPGNELIVVESDGEIVGTMQLTFIPGLSRRGAVRLQVEAVRVASRHRSQGIGRKMMEWAAERARERGCGMIQLTSDKARTDAHRFYASLGYEASHEGFKLLLS
ncbi:GNAT family N-acetyltransferase [Planotetraspora phitsanulokensis]|uniref:GNAT family acetyltransferase n=1 Tax=Planotetraspora phitsanulokensis TaxID=575192 RepID=A0A8J3UAY8_9ACTN|nr:GNAT family acetyltransferase [Planotetraspora phitsanulokensis]